MLSRLFPRALSVLIVLLLAGCSGKTDIPAREKIRVVSWNIEWFPGKRPEATTEESAKQMADARKALAELKPDVLLLQEIRDWKSAEELCRAVPGLQVHVASSFGDRPQNQIVASTLPADSAWSDTWKHGAIAPPRGYSFAALQVPGGRFLLSYSLHLKSNRGNLVDNVAMRQESARQLLAHVEEMVTLYSRRGPVAVLIGGDLNTSLDDPRFTPEQTLRAFQKAGLHWAHDGVPMEKRVTIPASGPFPDNCFDHIFTAGLGSPKAEVKTFPEISDHNPVVLDLDLTKAEFKTQLSVAAAASMLPATAPASKAQSSPVSGTLRADDHAAIAAAAGQRVTVRGKVQNVGATPNGSIQFINFAGNDRGQFVAIVRKEHQDKVAAEFGGDLKAGLTGREVEITGEIVLFNKTPQIAIAEGSQITVGDE